jgi:hypothetical protein
MNQRPIVLSLHLKGLSDKDKDVRTAFVHVIGSDVIASLIMTKQIRNNVILQNAPEAEDRAEDQGFQIRDNAILEALQMTPCDSIRQIAKMITILPTAVFRRLTSRLILSGNDCVGFPTTSQIFKNRLGLSGQRSY